MLAKAGTSVFDQELVKVSFVCVIVTFCAVMISPAIVELCRAHDVADAVALHVLFIAEGLRRLPEKTIRPMPQFSHSWLLGHKRGQAPIWSRVRTGRLPLLNFSAASRFVLYVRIRLGLRMFHRSLSSIRRILT